MTAPLRPEGRITHLFSGGVDSTMAACLLAERYESIHLVSYANGYGHYHLGRTAQRARELERHFPERFTHALLSVRELFDALVLDNLWEDYERYRSGFIWCLGCKVGMHIRTVAYNLEHGITKVADGSSSATGEMVEQMPASLRAIRDFYAEYGIAFENPVYERTREESIDELRRRGFRLGLRIGSRFLGTQPKCKPGELYYQPFVLLGSAPEHEETAVTGYIREKLDWGRAWIARRLAEKEST